MDYSIEYQKFIKTILYGLNEKIMVNFQFTYEGCYSFTSLPVANMICKEILNVSYKLGVDITPNSIVTDATAGVGGLTIELCRHFKFIQAVELDTHSHNCLLYNLRLLGISNAIVYNGYYQDYIKTLIQDIIIIDAPWHPQIYDKNKITTFLDSPKDAYLMPLETVIGKIATHAKLCVVKMPSNYDIQYFEHCVRKYGDIRWMIEIKYPNKIFFMFIVFKYK